MNRSDQNVTQAQAELEVSPGNQADPRAVLRILWGYKVMIAIVCLGVVGSAWIVAQAITPRYTATAALLLKPQETRITKLEEVVEDLDRAPETIQSEELVLQSRELVAKVVNELGLLTPLKSPLIHQNNGLLHHLNPLNYLPEDWEISLANYVRDLKFTILGEPSPPVALTVDEQDQARRKLVIDWFLEHLSVNRKEETRVIQVSFTTDNPRLASNAANALAEAYVRNTLEIKYAGTRDATVWLQGELEKLRQKVEASEAEAGAVRQGEALIQGRNADLVAQRLLKLNEKLAEVRAEADQTKVRLQQIKDLEVATEWEKMNGSVLDSDFIAALRVEKLDLESEAADLSTDYGALHPRIVNIQSQIAEVDKRISREIRRHWTDLENQLQAAQAHEASLRGLISELNVEAGDLRGAEVRLKALEREAQANRNLYESLLDRYKEVSVQEGILEPDALIISRAEIPTRPSYPIMGTFIELSFAVGLTLSLALIYAIEKLRHGFDTAKRLKAVTGLPVLGQIPEVSTGKVDHRFPDDYVVDQANTRYSEAINKVYSNLRWPRDNLPLNTVLVTSALPSEGKTSTAVSLARRAAQLGEKVILIDCDFRNPKTHQHLNLQSSPGIVEMLSMRAAPEEALQKDPASSARFLAAGHIDEEPISLVQSERFQMLLKAFEEHFTFVVIDTSPVLAVTEPQILARFAGQVLMTTRWRKTPRDSVLSAVEQLEDSGVSLRGLVLTRVNFKRQARYGYGEYGYYTKKAESYYAG